MYKLIIMDLDGTLLDSYGEVSLENRKSIKKAIDKGIEVVLASGRVSSSVEDLANNLEANDYYISGNGAFLYDMKHKEVIYENYMSKSKVLDIIKICDENSIYYNIYTDTEVIAKSLNYNVLFYNYENNKKSQDKKTIINIVQNIYEYIKNSENKKFLKITICDENKIIFDRIINKIRTIKDIDVLDVAHMSRKIIKSGTENVEINYYYTEISNLNVDKWYALEALMKKIGICKEEVIAIGDNVNDLKIIENSGVGIAMQNSAPYIKERADFICKNNNESGVSEAIEKYI